jgi:hypothetical protein
MVADSGAPTETCLHLGKARTVVMIVVAISLHVLGVEET